MKQVIRIVILLLSVVLAFPVYAAENSTPIYLSFEQRLLATYALAATNESTTIRQSILNRLHKIISDYAQIPVREVKVKNFTEFLEQWRGQWPNTQSLALDLEMIEKQAARGILIFKSDSERVQRKIDQYIAEQPLAVIEGLGLQDKSDFLKNVSNLNSENSEIEKSVFKYGDLLMNTQLKELDRVGEHFAQSPMSSNQDEGLQMILKTLFSEYYSRLSAESKKQIVSSLLGENLLMNDFSKFSIMIQNSGPQLQKMLQVVARQADLKPEMLELFRQLEDSVRQVPFRQVQEILEKEKSNYEFVSIERKPLGVGTMAQVHRAKIVDKKGQLHSVVVRFLKPGIMERVEEDHRILIEIAKILDANPQFRAKGGPKITPLVNDISNTVRAEFDIQDTIDRQLLAAKVYEKEVYIETGDIKNKIHFHVPRLYLSKNKSNLMVQELVIGRKLDKEVKTYEEVAPELKKIIIEEISKLWVEEAIFGKGFYHADLHQGNFLIQLTDPEIQVNILDYGMGGKITSAMQAQMILLGAGLDLKRPDLMSKAYFSLANKDQTLIKQEQLEAYIREKMDQIVEGKSEPLTIEGWTAFVIDHGIVLPYDFINMNRGIVILNKMLKSAGSSKTITALSRDLGRRHPTMIYNALIRKGQLSLSEFIRLGMRELGRILIGSNPQEKVNPVVLEKLRCEAIWN